MTAIITDSYYRMVAEMLKREIGGQSFFDDVILADTDGSVLKLNAKIYRDETGNIEDIQPFWWEFEYYDKTGWLCPSNFQFSKFKTFFTLKNN